MNKKGIYVCRVKMRFTGKKHKFQLQTIFDVSAQDLKRRSCNLIVDDDVERSFKFVRHSRPVLHLLFFLSKTLIISKHFTCVLLTYWPLVAAENKEDEVDDERYNFDTCGAGGHNGHGIARSSRDDDDDDDGRPKRPPSSPSPPTRRPQ